MTLAVGFDFDHTLGVDQGLERRAFVRLAAELGREIPPEDPVLTGIDELLAQFRADRLSLDDAVNTFVAALKEVRRGREGPPQGVHYREICYALVDELVEPLPGAVRLIAELDASGVRTGILTNGWSPLQQRKIARAIGDFAGPILVSDQLGTAKPADAAFACLAQALETARADVWYVGDNPHVDVAGAHAAGMRAAWLDWEGHAYPEEIAPPNAHIHRLLDLLPIVRGS